MFVKFISKNGLCRLGKFADFHETVKKFVYENVKSQLLNLPQYIINMLFKPTKLVHLLETQRLRP
jgi:hypothetical protein